MQDHSILRDALPWTLTIVSIFGTALNSFQDKKGFYLWLVANTGFMTSFILDDMYAQAFLFFVFILFNFVGLAKWK